MFTSNKRLLLILTVPRGGGERRLLALPPRLSARQEENRARSAQSPAAQTDARRAEMAARQERHFELGQGGDIAEDAPVDKQTYPAVVISDFTGDNAFPF